MKKLLSLLIRGYQSFDVFKHQVLFSVFGYSSVCRHRPTCSQYLLQQINEHGTITGLSKGFYRLITCW